MNVPVSLDRCPECGSTDIDQTRMRCEGDSIYVFMECCSTDKDGQTSLCATKWTETYTISHVEVTQTEPPDNFD